MARIATAALVLALASPASADQLHADLGLAVVGLGYEHPVATHVAVQAEAQAFSTYFLPWFSAGSSVSGFGGQARATWFSRDDAHGLYVAPYLRVDNVTNDHERTTGFCAGAFAGWAFAATSRIDVRIGAGAQYMRYVLATSKVDTPFVALDLVVGYRL
jgi:hypothetical protein